MVGGAVLLVGLASVSPSARSQTVELESFHGSFVFSGDQGEVASMGQAIDRVVDQMDMFIREIARLEIRRRVPREQRIRLHVRESLVTVSFDDWGPVELSVGGPGRQVRGPAGESLRDTLTFREGRLIERRIASRGSRTNVLSLSSDGRRLHMEVRITSDRLPSTIHYRLSYRRS